MALAASAQPEWLEQANQGELLQRAGRYLEAENCFRKALALVDPSDPLATAVATQSLASLQLLLNRPADAERLYRRVYDLRAAVLPPNDPRIGIALHGLAEALQERHRYAEAEPLYRRAAANLEAAFGPSSTTVADVRHNWAALYRDTHRDAEARPLLEAARSVYEKAAPRSPKLAVILRNLAQLEASGGNADRAQQLFDRALSICDASLPADHPQTGAILQAYAAFLRAQHRRAEANLMNRRAIAILQHAAKDNGTALTVDVSALAAR